MTEQEKETVRNNFAFRQKADAVLWCVQELERLRNGRLASEWRADHYDVRCCSWWRARDQHLVVMCRVPDKREIAFVSYNGERRFSLDADAQDIACALQVAGLLEPKVEQRPCNIGLFDDDARAQTDLENFTK